MNWFEKLNSIDRRVIFVIIALVIVVPTIFPFQLPIRVSRPTQELFDAIERIPDKKNTLILSVDYDPQTAPELHPMNIALLRHCFSRRIKVLILCLYVQNLGLAEDALQIAMADFNVPGATEEQQVINGRDYVFLGWKPPPIIPILGMGDDITDVFPTDYYGVPINERPMMENIKNYSSCDLLICLASGSAPEWYLAYAQTRFGIPISAGVTGVSVADYYPFLQSGQFTGLLEGMKGAAEYERLVAEKFFPDARRRATEGMSAQSATHIVIILFVIIGNIGYFLQRRTKKED
ncbi:hypothetical protein JXQ70_10100 [bacterium]|nr:hypothetical protein [bacterium]